MDSALNISSDGFYIQYNNQIFTNIHRDPEKAERYFAEMDKADISTPTIQEIKQSWWPCCFIPELTTNPVTADVGKEVNAQMDDAVNQYLDGGMSDSELSDTFQSLLTQLCDTCNERGYPTSAGLGIYGEQTLADCFYSEFRKKLLNEAVDRNYAEGLQYASNGKNGNWLYYNSDYYHKTESAMATMKGSVMEYCHEKGYEDFSLTPRKDEWRAQMVGYNYYDDFNSAWENRFNSEQTFLDKEQAPPKDFTWFYETGGTFAPGYVALIPDQAPKGPGFDPESFLSARMWATYKDADGNLHAGGTVFSYSFEKVPTNLKNVSALLSFMGGDDALSRYLQNLQVFRLGHFDKPHTSSIDFLA